MKQILVSFTIGSLLMGGVLGGFGYLKFNSFTQENKHLKFLLSKEKGRVETLKSNEKKLIEELSDLKIKYAKQFDKGFGALVKAKENASWKALYQLGLKAFNEKDIPRAYYALSEVYQKDPKFKDIEKFYPQVKTAFSKYKQNQFEQKLKNKYLKAFDQQAKGLYIQAQSSYQEVLRMKPNYKEAKKRLASVSQQVKLIHNTRDAEQKRKWVAATYQLGYNHQANGRYLHAKSAFQQIVQYAPKYKDSRKRLKMINAYLIKHPPPKVNIAPTQNIDINQILNSSKNKSVNCYQKGVEFGNCAANTTSPECKSMNRLSNLPLECKDSPDFKLGMKSVINSGAQSMLKGFKF